MCHNKQRSLSQSEQPVTTGMHLSLAFACVIPSVNLLCLHFRPQALFAMKCGSTFGLLTDLRVTSPRRQHFACCFLTDLGTVGTRASAASCSTFLYSGTNSSLK